MDSNIQFLIGICVVEVIVIAIIVWYYLKSTPSKSKKRNEVDEEIENELKNNK